MHRAMTSRAVCTSDGDPPSPSGPRCKHLHEPGIAKVRRTRKAPDFYSPENASKSCTRPKKSTSDDNDSWKPESETDEVNSESDAERSNGRREKSGTRRRMLPRKSPHHDEEHAEMETDEHPMPSEHHEETCEKAEGSSDTDAEEKSAKEKKRDTKNKERKVKGCRELQDLLDGCVQVHKESRTRRSAPRREHSRTLQTNGHSDTTWSNSSSRAATDKDSGNHHRQHLQNSSKQPSSLNTSSAQDAQRTVDSSTENPMMAEISETVEDDSKPFVSTRRFTNYARNNVAVTCTRKSKTTTAETVSDSSVRVKRQRVDLDTSEMRKMTKGVENGSNGTKTSIRDTNNKEDTPPVIKLPRMPMIRNGKYWYRARIKEESRESVFVEFTGFEDGSIKPFWIRKDSADVFKGSYSGKDWRHVGEGAWEPKPRKVNSKKQSNRGRRRGKQRGGLPRNTDTRDQSKASQDYTDQAYTGDSEKCSNPASGVVSGSGERVYYRKSSGEGQERGCLEKMRSGDSVVHAESPRREEKNMDCGSQSDVPVKDMRTEDSFPNAAHANAQKRTSIDAAQDKCKSEGRPDWATKPASGGSPFSRNAGTSGSSQLEDTLNKDGRKYPRHSAENNQREICISGGNEQSEGRMPTRLRRKSGKVPLERQQQEEDRTLTTRRPKALRRSARLGPKGSWGKFKDDSSSEAEHDEDSLNTPASRRNGNTMTRPTMSKYLTRSARHTDTGRRNIGILTSSQPLPRTAQVQKTQHRTIFHSAKRGKKAMIRRDDVKDEFYEDEYDEVFENEDRAEYQSCQNRSERFAVHRRVEKRVSVMEGSDGVAVWNLGVNVLSQIRKYLPYYCNHIADARLSAFVELMERLDGVRLKSHAPTLKQSPEIPSKDLIPSTSAALPSEVSDKTLGLPSLNDREKL